MCLLDSYPDSLILTTSLMTALYMMKKLKYLSFTLVSVGK